MNQYAIPLANIVDDILGATENKPKYLRIFSDWECVVGKKIASISAPYRVVTAGSQKVLVLKCKKGHALQMQHQSQLVLEKVHGFLEKSFFSQLKIVQLDVNDQLNS